MRALLTWWFVVYFFTSSFILYLIGVVICALTAPFDRNRKVQHLYSCAWGYHYLRCLPFWDCRFEGKEYIEKGKTYVLVANHQSLCDILALYGLFRHYKWVSKDDIFKVPVVGWNMRLNQYVEIKRGNLKSIKEMLNDCKDWVNKGSSVMIFPEGTRSVDGEIHPFRDGAFRISVETGVPLIPIVIDGTFEIIGKGSKYLSPGKVRVKVLPPVEPAQFNNSSAEMRNAVHDLMVKTLAEMRGKKPAQPPLGAPASSRHL